MVGGKLEGIIGLKEETVQKAVSLAMKAYGKFPAKPFLLEKSRSSNDAFFAFPGTWAVEDWYHRNPYGEVKIDVSIFPSMKCVGTGEVASVNEAFSRRFQEILSNSSLEIEVEKALSERKQVIFAGHSSGGAVAVLFAIWFLEKYVSSDPSGLPPFCVTFGAPLVSNPALSHALRRENWARSFVHFVAKYDVVPRIMFSPLPSIEQGLQPVLNFMNPKSSHFLSASTGKSSGASSFLARITRNALSVASHAACNLKGCSNLLLETISSIVARSPYSPFGTFAFCAGNGKLIVLDNPDAVLQLLFYCLQLNPEENNPDFVYVMFRDHFSYESELKMSLSTQNVSCLDDLVDLPLRSDTAALDDLGLTTRARLSLRAAGELEKQKLENQKRIDSKKDTIKEALNKVQEYQKYCSLRKIGYYDAFRIQRDSTNFNANINRIELAGIWDEIMEMIRQYELPDGFEGRKEWIELGTLYRRLVEPLDIANYYRHLKNEDTGPYMVKARPKRYRFTQKWHEHAEKMPSGSSSESTFWAEVEELRLRPFPEVRDKVSRFEEQVSTWIRNESLGRDVFLYESTFTKWWKTLPLDHRSRSCVAGYILFY